MNAYIYQADLYCEDCGASIRKLLLDEGKAPKHWADESSYDSDEFPKGPYSDGGGESDTPNHCGNHSNCENSHELSYGRSVGSFLENPLTTDGYEYVRIQIRENPSEVTQMWAEFYQIENMDTEEAK